MTLFRFFKSTVVFIYLTFIVSLIALPVSGQARKSCPGGVVLRASASVANQGTLLLAEVVNAKGTAAPASEWDGHAEPLWKEGAGWHALLGVDLEKKPGLYEWKVTWPGAEGTEVTCSLPITVRAGKFPTERLNVPQQYVKPDPEQQKRAEEDGKKLKVIYDTVTPERLWDGKFQWPLKDVTTGGNFGRRRVLNGEARSPHAGVDFPAAAGTPVFASQSGKVLLAEELYYSGNTVIIDHGYGIFTMYCHFSKIDVTAGDKVAAGDEIGKVGATGRVTGPHLHWGLTIQHARVNGMGIVARQP